MKKNILLFISFAIILITKAQIIYDAKFLFTQESLNRPNLLYFSDKITISKTMNDTTWFNTAANNPSGIGFYCLTRNKILKYHKPTNNFNIYYDYNLLKDEQFIVNIGQNTDTFKVDSVYYIQYGSLKIKSWHLTSKNKILGQKKYWQWLQGLGEINSGWDLSMGFIIDKNWDVKATCIGDSILTTEVGFNNYGCDFDSLSRKLSLKNVKIVQSNLYPNPVNDLLNLKFNNSNKNDVYIYDVKGNLIFNLSTNESKLEIDFSKFNSGIYMVKTLSNKTIEMHRVVKL